MLQVHADGWPYFSPISAPPHRSGGGHPGFDPFFDSDHTELSTDTERCLWTENGLKNIRAGECTSAILHSPTDSLTI